MGCADRTCWEASQLQIWVQKLQSLEAKECADSQILCQRNAVAVRQWADRPSWSIRTELRWSFTRGKCPDPLVWGCLGRRCRIGWRDPPPLGTLVAIVKEAGDPIVGSPSGAKMQMARKAAKQT
jgi:hypothetical protein